MILDDILQACDHVVVGALTNPDHYDELGIERSAAVEGHGGRAQLPDGMLVQLAELGAPFDDVLAALATMPEADR